MIRVICGVTMLVAAQASSLGSFSAYANDDCEARSRAGAVASLYEARIGFVHAASSKVHRQVATLMTVNRRFTADEKALLIAESDSSPLPEALQEKIQRFESDYFEVLCQRGESAVDGEYGWKCVGANTTYADAPDPLLLRELTFAGSSIYACTDYVTRDGVTPAIDAYLCSELGLETGEIYGQSATTSIDQDVVSAQVFAFFNDIPLHESSEVFIEEQVVRECH